MMMLMTVMMLSFVVDDDAIYRADCIVVFYFSILHRVIEGRPLRNLSSSLSCVFSSHSRTNTHKHTHNLAFYLVHSYQSKMICQLHVIIMYIVYKYRCLTNIFRHWMREMAIDMCLHLKTILPQLNVLKASNSYNVQIYSNSSTLCRSIHLLLSIHFVRIAYHYLIWFETKISRKFSTIWFINAYVRMKAPHLLFSFLFFLSVAFKYICAVRTPVLL